MKDYSERVKNNYLVAQQLRDRPAVVPGMPNVLIIEPGAVCPLKCPFCPQTSEDFDLTRALLKFKDFRRIINYFEDSVDTVLLFNWGEPLLNPHLPKMIAYVCEKNIRTIVHSNLNFLNKDLPKRLIKTGLSELVASIDGASQESYQVYRKGGSFELALGNLKILIEQKKKKQLATPNIIWKFLVFRHNEREMEKARKIAEQIGVNIEFNFAFAQGEYESTIDEYSNKDFVNKFIKNYDLPCDQLWKSPVILPDGSVLPCCMVSQKKYILGNLFSQDFRSIWNGEQYQLLRKTITGEIAVGNHFFCYYCVFNPEKIRNKLSV